jgi:hypothetical protein
MADKLGISNEFETAEPVEKPSAPPGPPPAQKFFREIDLGDGSGVQRFEADSYEALVDKFVTAQTNATRKIQELSRGQQRKQLEPEKQSSDFQELRPTVLTPDELAKFQTNPHEMFRRMYQAETGLSFDEFRTRENQRRRQEAEFKAQRDFTTAHSADYAPTPENAQKIMNLLQSQDLPISKHNLDWAFQELRGELVSKKASPVESAPAPAPVSDASKPAPRNAEQNSPPPSFIRPSLGGRAVEETSEGMTAAEVARIAQSQSLGEMKARIEQYFRQLRTSAR